MTRTIVSLGVGSWYPKGIERLRASCITHDTPHHLVTSYPVGAPTHEQIPYAFKPYLMKQVGSIVLWLDASCYLQHDPKPLFDHIEKYGYLFFENGWNNAQWSSDMQLEAFEYTRDEAENQQQIVGGIMGLDLDSEIGRQIFAEWFLCVDLFKGEWTNKNKTESQDARCLGSRHDQAVMSLIVAELDLNITPQAGWLSFDPKDELAVIIAQGM